MPYLNNTKKRIGIIVDGQSDYLSINKRYGAFCYILKTDGPRGHTARVKDIVCSSNKQVSILKAYRCKKIILLLDFENRHLSLNIFEQELCETITRSNFEIEVCPIVVNKMIENWYLSDIEILSKKKKYLRDKLKQKNYEGKDGKKELKKLFKPGIEYKEVQHGPDLFNTIREIVSKKNSASFDNFIKLLKSK